MPSGSHRLDSEDVLELVRNADSYRNLFLDSEGEWLLLTFESGGHTYELGAQIRTGKVSLYDNQKGDEVYNSDH